MDKLLKTNQKTTTVVLKREDKIREIYSGFTVSISVFTMFVQVFPWIKEDIRYRHTNIHTYIYYNDDMIWLYRSRITCLLIRRLFVRSPSSLHANNSWARNQPQVECLWMLDKKNLNIEKSAWMNGWMWHVVQSSLSAQVESKSAT